MVKLFEETSGGEGIYVQQYKIKSIAVNDNSGNYPKDIDLVFGLETKTEDSVLTKNMFISGKLIKGESIPPHLTQLLYACGIEEHPDYTDIIQDFANNIISQKLSDFFINKEIKVLSFVSGTYNSNGSEKPSYKLWNGRQGFKNNVNTYSITTPDNEIIEAFKKQLSLDYPPPYTPDVLKELQEKSNMESPIDEGEEDLI
jgi:hypothetical protein